MLLPKFRDGTIEAIHSDTKKAMKMEISCEQVANDVLPTPGIL
ncbi:MAG: hypothetical protein V3V88_02050 [Dehalococcoidia bacterium]